MTKAKPEFYRRNYGKNHAYYLRGEKLDGVTTLLSNGLPKPALVNWAANTTAEFAVNHWDELAEMAVADRLKDLKAARFADRDAAAQRGTEVHELAERLARGEEVEVPDAIRGHVESARDFLDDFEVEVILSETSCVHQAAQYAGTFDLLLTSRKFPGRVILADWKTNRSGIYPETALQLTAYARSTHYLDADGQLQPISELGITDCWAIWIRSDGYEVYPMSNTDETWKAFGHIVAVARTSANAQVNSGWKGSPLSLPIVTVEAGNVG